MSEEKRKYIVVTGNGVSKDGNFYIFQNSSEKDILAFVKDLRKVINDDEVPRIFKIEEEIYWQEESREEITEKKNYS